MLERIAGANSKTAPEVDCLMNRITQTLGRTGMSLVVVSLVSACSSSEHAAPKSVARSGAPWARDLNEPPSNREPASAATAQTKADLNAARQKAVTGR